MSRRVHSIQAQLMMKSKEAALNAVQTFNNPLTIFKSEAFIVQMIIAWMYLLHAYYRREGVDYRHWETGGKRLQRTEGGAIKYWSLRTCIRSAKCPLDKPTKANLGFLIALRDEIEHQMCLGLDGQMSSRYLACCLNFESSITGLFGARHSLQPQLSFALQFSQISPPTFGGTSTTALPSPLATFIQTFDDSIADEDFQSPRFAYRLLFTRKLANHKGQADSVIEFVSPDSELGDAINKQYWFAKDVEKPKLRATEIVALIRDEGHARFGPHQHTLLWKKLDGKNPKRNYCIELGGQWFWYENWVTQVRKECEAHPELYGPLPDMGMTA